MVLREKRMKGVFKGDELKSNVIHLKKTTQLSFVIYHWVLLKWRATVDLHSSEKGASVKCSMHKRCMVPTLQLLSFQLFTQ